MELQDQNVNEQTVQQNVTNKCRHTPVIIVLAILLVCSCAFGGFELYQNIKKGDQSCSTECDNNDSSNEEDDEASKPMITGSASFAVPNPPYDEGTNDGTVKFEYGVLNNVLSTYSISYHLHPYGHIVSEIVSSNVDLNTGENLDNEKALERFDVAVDEVYHKILEDMVGTVSVDSFLLDVNGNVSAGTISVGDFEKNIDEYVETLKDDYSLFYVFLKDSGVTVSYKQSEILEKLGMSSHMDQGLVRGYIEIELQSLE